MPRTVVECGYCDGEGFTSHDCGEDSCPCLYPENNVPCPVCQGAGDVEVPEDDDEGSDENVAGI